MLAGFSLLRAPVSWATMPGFPALALKVLQQRKLAAFNVLPPVRLYRASQHASPYVPGSDAARFFAGPTGVHLATRMEGSLGALKYTRPGSFIHVFDGHGPTGTAPPSIDVPRLFTSDSGFDNWHWLAKKNGWNPQELHRQMTMHNGPSRSVLSSDGGQYTMPLAFHEPSAEGVETVLPWHQLKHVETLAPTELRRRFGRIYGGGEAYAS